MKTAIATLKSRSPYSQSSGVFMRTKAAPDSEMVELTPEIARMWCKCISDKQRPLSEGHVQYLVRIIQNDEWSECAPGRIVFDEEGMIIDGQHRVHAIARAGKKVWVEVTYNRPTIAGAFVDTNKPRRVGEQLVFTGVLNKRGCNKKGSVGRYIVMIENPSVRKATEGEVSEAITRYAKSFNRVLDMCPGRGVMGRAPVQAALIVAHSSHPALVENFIDRAEGRVAKDAGDVVDKWKDYLSTRAITDVQQAYTVFYSLRYIIKKRVGRPEFQDVDLAVKEFVHSRVEK